MRANIGTELFNLGRLKLIVCFASKYFRNPMREGENTAQTPGKSTGLFHCHLALQSQNVSGAKPGETFQMAVNTRTCYQVCLDQVLATFHILDPQKTSKTMKMKLQDF